MSGQSDVSVVTKVEGSTIQGTVTIDFLRELDIEEEIEVVRRSIGDLRLCMLGHALEETRLAICKTELRSQGRLCRNTEWRESLSVTENLLSRTTHKREKEVALQLTRFRTIAASIELEKEICRSKEDVTSLRKLCGVTEEILIIVDRVEREINMILKRVGVN